MLKAKEAAANTVFLCLDTTSSQNRIVAFAPQKSYQDTFRQKKYLCLCGQALKFHNLQAITM